MICSKCGNDINGNVKFCSRCGNKVEISQMVSADIQPGQYIPNSSEKPKKNGLKAFLFILIGLLLGVAVGALVMFVLTNLSESSGSDKADNDKRIEKDDDKSDDSGKSRKRSKSDKIEGAGFDTAEEAVTEYLERYCDGDMNAIYECFAIESMVDNYTIYNMVDRLQAMNPNMSIKQPVYSELSRNISIEGRKSDIYKMLFYHYRVLMQWSDDTKSMPIMLDDKDPQELVTEYMPDNEASLKNGIIIDAVLNPEDITELWNREGNIKNRDAWRDCMGAEEIESLPVVFHTDAGYFVWYAGAVKYNGRWYVDMNPSILSSIMGIAGADAGMEYIGAEFDVSDFIN